MDVVNEAIQVFLATSLSVVSPLLLSECLYPLCREIDEVARSRLAAIPDCEKAYETISMNWFISKLSHKILK